jgi:signal transduction histidine kinase
VRPAGAAVGDNGVVSTPSTRRRDLVDGVRRLAHHADWPLVAAILLGLLALAQVAGGGGESTAVAPGPRTPPVLVNGSQSVTIPILLALCATVPVAVILANLVLAAVTVTAANYLTLASEYDPTLGAFLAQVLVGYVVARHGAGRMWLLPLLPLAAYFAAPIGSADRNQGTAAAMLVATAAATAIAGIRRHRSDAAARQLSEEALAGSVIEHAARGERARIARELHDVVAHHISMISVQAETARLTTAGLPADGARQLSAIGDTAREALTEMRRLLGVLREDAETDAERAPQPGLAELTTLLDDARVAAGGASTRLIVRGQVTALEPGVELTAYRIVQEALTNARRHAPGAAVDVELDFAGDVLLVRVRDNGPGPSRDSATVDGHGLLGMRERVSMVGGTLRAGATGFGGFQVEVTLPVERVEP